MIVRISADRQYRLSEDKQAEMNRLDNAAVAAAEGEDEDAFREAFGELLTLVQTAGTALDEEELVGSDLILPPADLSFAEAKAEFTGEGLIPE